MTHGEYTAARAKYDQAVALEALDARHRRALRFAMRASPDASSSASGSTSTTQRLHRRLSQVVGSDDTAKLLSRSLQQVPDQEYGIDEGDVYDMEAFGDLGPEPYYMVVGFEVSPCSIQRVAGKEIEDVVCGVEGDTTITPQEVTEGAKIVYT